MDEEEERPQCICVKTDCLQRYCRCFEAMWFCDEDCSCQGCRNTYDNEDEVEERAEMIMKKKPEAFKPKIAGDADAQCSAGSTNVGQELARRHVKACNCRKSKCMKKYCECLKNGVRCSARCQCEGCGNDHGAKAATGTDGQQFDDIVSSNGRPGSSSGISNGTASVVDSEIYWPIDASLMENFMAFGDSSDVDSHIQALSDSDFDNMFHQHVGDGDYFEDNVHTQTHEGFARTDE